MEWIKRIENLRGTLKETFTAKYDGILPRTPLVRPKSKICNIKRDDKYPHPFHMGVPPLPVVANSGQRFKDRDLMDALGILLL